MKSRNPIFSSLILILILINGSIDASELFKINPYLIMVENKKASLNFWTKKDIRLDIKVEFFSYDDATTSNEESFSQVYSNKKLQRIILKRLKCGSVLRYQITHVDSGKVIDHTLSPLSCGQKVPLRFGFMSDTQIKNGFGRKRAKTLAKLVSRITKREELSFIINAGDIVQTGGSHKEWEQFFNIGKEYLQRNYLISAVGNHSYDRTYAKDKAPDIFRSYLRTPKSSKLGLLAIDFGQVQFLVINSSFDKFSVQTIKRQWAWLKNKLEMAKLLNKTTIIVSHHSPFSSSLEHYKPIPSRLRKELVPLIEKYRGVKLVLSGHLHMYERSIKEGIHYLIAGPSGGIYNPISYKNPYMKFVRPFDTTFTSIRIDNKKAEVMTYGLKGSLIDKIELDFR